MSSLVAETPYVVDEKTGLRLLRPNRVFVGSQVTLRSNSLGLRSPEIPLARAENSWRIAVIGASTVMGAFEPDTQDAFPGRLEQRLHKAFPQRQIDVVNAGMAGFTLEDQRRMLETQVAKLTPDLAIVYPGFNDFAGYCQSGKTGGVRFKRQSLPVVKLPAWLISVDVVKKNTVFLRTADTHQPGRRKPLKLDLTAYRNKLEALITRAAELKIPLLLATNARAYRPEQPREEQIRLSETARYYNHCFDLDGLHELYDIHNKAIQSVAAAHHVPVIALDKLVPGGSRYFVDSSHLSAEGDSLVAETLKSFIVDHQLLPN